MPPERLIQNIDEQDLTLITELQINARQSAPVLARKLNTSPSTVKRRLQRLVERQVISFATVVHPAATGHQMSTIMLINVQPGKADVVADALTSIADFNTVVISSGQYDIIAGASFSGPDELIAFLGSVPTHISGLANIEPMVILRVRKGLVGSPTDITAVSVVWESKLKQGLDALDTKLIAEMEAKPRSTHSDLAKNLGISRPTARARAQRLLREDIVRVVCVPNPLAFGRTTQVGILMKAYPGEIVRVADQLASYKMFHYVVITAGRYDVTAWTSFADNSQMSSFLRNDLGNLAGVKSSETVMNLRVTKFPFVSFTDLKP